MSELDAETLELFIEESLEALMRVERLLLDAERGKPDPDLLATLFRDLHTIKGTSGFLALKKILMLSHAAEDLLGRLRDRTSEPRPEHFTRLMSVVDLLRQLIANVRETHDEGDIDVQPLVQELRGDAAPEALASEKTALEFTESSEPATDETRSESAAPVRESADGTVRVNVALLDRLMNLMGELVLARNQVIQLVKTHWDSDAQAQAASQRLRQVTAEMQEQIMKTRMQPVARVFDKIPRMVRDLCQTTGKRVACQIEGTATEIDKALVEAIRDPVTHLVRNAVDHGIETLDGRLASGKLPVGKLSIRASHESGMVQIEVEDDGRGIDPRELRQKALQRGMLTVAEAERLSDREAFELVFRPGFSTATTVTEISGRGVGMDVVRNHVERAGGEVELDSNIGRGTIVRLKMPLTLAIIPALLIKAGKQRFAIPQAHLVDLVYLNEEQARSSIEYVRDAAIYRLRGEVLPLVRLSRVLGIEAARPIVDGEMGIVVVAARQRRYGLVVDEIHDTEEIVIKPLHRKLQQIASYSGATVLSDGGVALILEVQGVAAMAGIDLFSTPSRTPIAESALEEISSPQPFVVFQAGEGALLAVPLRMVARLEHIPKSSLEVVAGAEVVQYRKAILPVVRPEAVLPIGKSRVSIEEEQPLIVFDFGHMVGMAVDKILDIVNIRQESDEDEEAIPFILGKTVVFGKAALLVDVYHIVRELAPQFVFERRQRERRPRLLLADDSNAMRTALASYLRTQGFDIVDVNSGDNALREVRAHGGRFDAVVTDLEMAGLDGFGLIQTLRSELPQLPVFVWTYQDDLGVTERALTLGARACIHKLRREELITAMHQSGIGLKRRASDPDVRRAQ